LWVCLPVVWPLACAQQEPVNVVVPASDLLCVCLSVALPIVCAPRAPVQAVVPASNLTATDTKAPAPARAVKFGGVLKDHAGHPLTGTVGVLFSIYEEETGTRVWQEVQNVEVDRHGFFAATVGSTRSEGIDPAIFHADRPLWIALQVLLPGEVEQPGRRLVSGSNGLLAKSETNLVIPQDPLIPTAAIDSDATEDGSALDSPPAQDPNGSRRHSGRSRRRSRP